VRQTERHGYIVTVMAHANGRGEWDSRWSAVKTDSPFEAHFKAADAGAPYLTEFDADQAGLQEGCAWVDSHGRR